MARESQYTDTYLDCNDDPTHAITVGTFLNRELRGRAKTYSFHYHSALVRSLTRRESEGSVERIESVGGGVAWRRVD